MFLWELRLLPTQEHKRIKNKTQTFSGFVQQVMSTTKYYYYYYNYQWCLLLTCWDSPFRETPLTFMMTSPTSICPLSAAGCPGNSFLTLTMLEPGCSGETLSSRQKLKPRPELFFTSFTANVFSAKERERWRLLGPAWSHSAVHLKSENVHCTPRPTERMGHMQSKTFWNRSLKT